MKRIEIQECKMELVYLMNEPGHAYQGIELLYMVDKEAEIQTDVPFTLKENDIVVFNSGEEHAIRCKRKAIAFRLLIPYRLLGKLSTDEILYFQCNSALFKANNYSELVRLVEQLVLRYLKLDTADLSGLSSALFQIIQELFKSYKIDPNKIGQISPKLPLGKIDRILNYIRLHASEPLNLSELAEYFHMSEAYFSHYFKEKVGENYLSYLNEVRIQNATLDLCQTEDSVTEIALNNGFSTPSVFNRHFKKTYGKTPMEYRNEMLESRKSMELTEEKIEAIQQQISEKIELESSRKAKPELIRVSASHTESAWENINSIMNLGETPAVCPHLEPVLGQICDHGGSGRGQLQFLLSGQRAGLFCAERYRAVSGSGAEKARHQSDQQKRSVPGGRDPSAPKHSTVGESAAAFYQAPSAPVRNSRAGEMDL